MSVIRTSANIALSFLVLSQVALAKPAVRQEGPLVFDGIPAIPQTLKDRLQQYSEARNASIVGFDPRGEGIVIATRFANTAQLHKVRAPGAARYQLTFDSEPIAGAEIRPSQTERGVLISQDSGGGEFFQLYYLDLDSGRRKLLTDGKSRYSSGMWSPTGQRVACASTERNGKDTDVTLLTLDGKRQTVTQREGSWTPVAWSKDEKFLLVQNYKSITDSRLYVLDLASGQLKDVDPNPEPVAHGTGVFTANDLIVYTSDRDSEFLKLHALDPATGHDIVLTPDLNWGVTALAINPAGDRIVYAANEGGLSSVFSWNAHDPAPEAMPLPQGIADGFHFSPDGQTVGFTLDTGNAPADVYSFSLVSGETKRWTESEVGGLNPESFVSQKLVKFPSFDGTEISAFVAMPKSAKGPVPALIMIHGGPEAQYQPSFSSLIQFLAADMGIAVIAPNVRGSDGYGKTFLSMDNGFKREDSVKDIGALLDWIALQPELDKSRVAVYGGSYGGYMVLASLTHYSDRLRAGVDVVGISNFVTFLKNTQDYRRDLRRVEYGDERDPAMLAHLEKISPLNSVDKIGVPLLVVQGLNDPRVPTSEAEQIVKAVRGQGKECWYLLAKDEGHGFKKKSNRDAYLQTLALFLETYLLK
jgi:dipeptidyl aminopeptidase/acylaminoacyl peptidase